MPYNLALTARIPGNATKDQVWKAILIQARDATGFIPAITACEVVEESGPTKFTRKLLLLGQTIFEEVELFAPSLVSDAHESKQIHKLM
jgi:hypothetical protein